MGLYCDLDELLNESDVEQKFIYQFLSQPSPMGLGFESNEIFTKIDLRRVTIGKGKSQKIYYPDYVVSIRGIPVLVLEAKKTTEDLNIAYSEARMYATEINSKFEHGVNVNIIIMVSNGAETWAGYYDTAEPLLKLMFDDFNIEGVKFSNLIDFCSKEKLSQYADQLYKERRGKARFITPVSSLGGRLVQNEELDQNAFGSTLVFENSKIFDPETEEEKCVIVDNAYIPSAKREQHAEPIYKEIRKYEPASIKRSVHLATDNPIELANSISMRIEKKLDVYSLMLIIGNVGSGKTTFIRWFKRRFLEPNHPELAAKCDWIFMNMNLAPNSQQEIYNWIKKEFLKQIQENHSEIAFKSLETIRHIFRNEIADFDNGIGQLLKADESRYSYELYKLLKDKSEDDEKMLIGILNHLKGDYGLIPIVVLDNCDKRSRDTQLLMFDVAQWLRSNFKCIVIMPMRDNTYDTYKDEKPLDTIVKDLVFRIDPPDLLKVLQARLEYISRSTKQNTKEYKLKNGMTVRIGSDELVEYYKSIMMAIRQSSMIRNIFYRLSDKNTRKGIELFEDFCKSGHITADEIFQIRATDGICKIPDYKFLNVILRKNRRYYNGEESGFINLFGSDYRDDFPDPFIRIDILQYVNESKKSITQEENIGFCQYNDIIRRMEVIGHKSAVAKREMNYLIKKGLLRTESQLNCSNQNDLIKITIPGMLHLNMLNYVGYLAACSENVYFKNTDTVTKISNRLKCDNYLSRLSMYLNANDLIEYLSEYRKEYIAHPAAYMQSDEITTVFDLEPCRVAMSRILENNQQLREDLEKIQKYQIGSIIRANVVNKKQGALICLINGIEGHRGFLSYYDLKYNLKQSDYMSIEIDDKIVCEVLSFDIEHNDFSLKFKNKE